MTATEFAIALAGIAVVIAGAAGATIALRLSRIPGGAPAAAIVGGLLAGALLGPSVLGRAVPAMYESLIFGGRAESLALLAMQSEHQAEIAALRSIDASPIAIAELQQAHRKAEAPLIESLLQGRGRRFLLQTTAGLGAIALWLLMTALASPVQLAARRADARVALAGAQLALILTTGIAALLAHWLVGAPLAQAIPFGLACAVTMWVFDYRALASDTLRQASAPTGWIAGGVLGMGAIALVTDSFEAAEVAVALVCIAMWVRHRRPGPHRPWRRRRLRWRAAWTIGAPSMVALTALQLDFAALFRDVDFWIATAIAVFLCHDGRWLGGAIAYRLIGDDSDRASMWQRSGVVLDLGVGGLQCAAALLLLETRAVSDALLGALLVGAAVLELFQPVRQPVARWMDRSQREMDEMSAA